MNSNISLKLTTHECELNEVEKFKIVSQVEKELIRAPESSKVSLDITRTLDKQWVFDLSLKYNRGHIASLRVHPDLESAVKAGLVDLKRNLLIHESQAIVETFHFDKSSEYDYFTEVSLEVEPSPLGNLTTLVLEDDPAASLILKTTLNSLGCGVDSFENPHHAIEAMKTKSFDLLVLDWNLPYMKGHEFLIAADRILRNKEVPSQLAKLVPVVICTSMPLEQITLPPVSHFFFCNHWHKSLPFSSVLNSLDETTKKISLRKRVLAS